MDIIQQNVTFFNAETGLRSTVLAPCEYGPLDGVGVQGGGGGGGGGGGAPRAVLLGGQRAGHQVGQGAQTQVTVDTKQDIAHISANRTT